MPSLNYWTGTAWQPVWGGGSTVDPASPAEVGVWTPAYESSSGGGNLREGSGKYFWIPGPNGVNHVTMYWAIEVLKADIALLRDDEPLLIERVPYYPATVDLYPEELDNFLKHTPAQAHAAWKNGTKPVVGTLRCFLDAGSYFLVYDLKTLTLGTANSVWLTGTAHTYTQS